MALTNYWWLLIWLFIVAVVSIVVPVTGYEYVLGREERRWKYSYAMLLILPYLLWSAFRVNDNFGDTASYREAFLSAPNAFAELPIYLETITKDKGFYILTAVIKIIFGNSDILYFLILASFQLIVLMMVFRKYSCDYWISMYIFVASTDFYSWVWNTSRQFTAVILIFAATTLILKKKYVPVVAIILLASTIHGSALLMLPIVFIIQGKAWNKKTVLCIIACIVALIFVDQFTDILDILLADTQYTNVVSDWQSWADDGTNPVRVLVYAVPMILSIVGYRYIKNEDDPVINMAVNASIVTTGLGIVAMGTSGIFIGRLPIYVSLYSQCILLPWEINHIFTESSARLIKMVTVICYCAFFYYQMHYTWGLL